MSAATSSSNYQFISPLKKGGKRKLVDSETNIYVEERQGSDVKYYRCHRGRSEGCIGRGILRDGVFLQSKPHDQHSGDAVKLEKFRMRVNLHKTSVSNQFAPSSTIVQEVIGNLTDEAIVKLPKHSALRRDVQRARAKVFGNVTRPSCIEDLDVPPNVKHTKKGAAFLRYDSYEDDKDLPRIIVFATNEFLEILGSAETLLMDGTFKSSPRLFCQLFIIHGLVDGFVVPLAYACMERRDKDSYVRLFNSLMRRVHADFTPSTIIVDFECASIAALEEVFPTANLQACLFHFSQSILRKVAELGHRTKYLRDESFRMTVRSFIVFAFVPIPDVRARFLDYKANLSQEYDDFAEYFYRTYIGSTARPAKYPVHLWNVVSRLENDLPRTTNSCEGYHNGLARRMRALKPDFARCILQLIQEQSQAEINITRSNAGIPPPQLDKVNRLTTALLRCYSSYNVKPLEEYLRGIALNFQFTYKQRTPDTETD